MLHDLSALPQESFREPPVRAVWKQVNVALVRADGDARASARALFSAVVPELGEWHERGTLHRWFFMRKPPDVRLRFCTSDPDACVETIGHMLTAAALRGEIGEFCWSEYEPETERFGGPRGMSLAHAYFNVDATLWFALDALRERGLRATSPDMLMPAVLHHLFERCCGADLVADGWRALAAIIDVPVAHDGQAVQDPPALVSLAGDARLELREREALAAYAAADDLLGSALRDAALVPCEVAATVALFNLNRHGFPGERSAPMVARVLAALGSGR